MTDQLVTVQWLKDHLDQKHLIVLDASTAFKKETTIPGAQHFDIKNTFSDTSSPFPNTFPRVDRFEIESRRLGITSNSHIIVFDDKGIFTSPRVWFMFRAMGHRKVSVLDGGLPAWNAHKFPVGSQNSHPRAAGDFKANFNPSLIKTYHQITKNIETANCLVLDARSKGRFTGNDPEPRKHIQSGHIKNSINLPYTEVLNTGNFKSKEELQAIFKALDLDDKPLIFSCGSGITACIILLAYHLISNKMAMVYDGSWTEWAEKEGLFVDQLN